MGRSATARAEQAAACAYKLVTLRVRSIAISASGPITEARMVHPWVGSLGLAGYGSARA